MKIKYDLETRALHGYSKPLRIKQNVFPSIPPKHSSPSPAKQTTSEQRTPPQNHQGRSKSPYTPYIKRENFQDANLYLKNQIQNEQYKNDKILEKLKNAPQLNLYTELTAETASDEKPKANQMYNVTDFQYMTLRKNYKELLIEHKKIVDELDSYRQYQKTEGSYGKGQLLSESLLKLEGDVKEKDREIEHLKEINRKLHQGLNQVKKKLRFQFQINQKILSSAQKAGEDAKSPHWKQSSSKTSVDKELESCLKLLKEKQLDNEILTKKLRFQYQNNERLLKAGENAFDKKSKDAEISRLKSSLLTYKAKLQFQYQNSQCLLHCAEKAENDASVFSTKGGISKLLEKLKTKEVIIHKLKKTAQKLKKKLLFQFQNSQMLVKACEKLEKVASMTSNKDIIVKFLEDLKIKDSQIEKIKTKLRFQFQNYQLVLHTAEKAQREANIFSNKDGISKLIEKLKAKESQIQQLKLSMKKLRKKLQFQYQNNEIILNAANTREKEALAKSNKISIETFRKKLQLQFQVSKRLFIQENQNIFMLSQLCEPEYLSDCQLQEFIYILIKNLESSQVDSRQLEYIIFNNAAMKYFQNRTSDFSISDLICMLASSLCDILQVTNLRDNCDIISFVRTFAYNHYLCKDGKEKNPEELIKKFISLFDCIRLYSNEQKERNHRELCKKLNPIRHMMTMKLKFFDEKKTGYITLPILKKIIEQLKVNWNNEILEYSIFVMKFNCGGRLRDLKYDNMIQMIDEYSSHPNEETENEFVEETRGEQTEDEFQITNHDFQNTVKRIVISIAECLISKGKALDYYFIQNLSTFSFPHQVLELEKLVEVLRDEFKIELSSLDTYCLLMRFGHDNTESKNEESPEIMIDYDKFAHEVNYVVKQKYKMDCDY